MQQEDPHVIRRRRALYLFSRAAVLLAALPAFAATAGAAEDPWPAVRDGRAFAMIRHARAPGTGDPARFDVSDCSTQRNLDDAGRRQATRLGDMFRNNGVSKADVFTSAWCRCHDTATLLRLGDVTVLPSLNSFFETRDRETEQTNALVSWLDAWQSPRPLVLVTHQVNITALTGIYPQSGEIIFVTGNSADGYTVIGREAVDA